jgi:pyruvate/2-oxoglutarate dehydrogenase complex dihydrolipoamide acyltransferase (E2) component
MTNNIGDYKITKFTRSRQNISLMLEQGKKRHVVHAYIEVDVTGGKTMIKNIHKQAGIKLSFTGWVIKCIAKCIEHHPLFNTFRHGTKKMMTFSDIDIAIPVDRTVEGNTRPRAYIIRKVNEKTLIDISSEIQNAQKESINRNTQLLGKSLTKFERFALGSPLFIQKLLLSIYKNNAFLKKTHFGTCAVTTVGTIPNFQGWIGLIGGNYTLQVGIGGITKKRIAMENGDEEREILYMDIAVDHDIIDGVPLAQFTIFLRELIEKKYGLKI